MFSICPTFILAFEGHTAQNLPMVGATTLMSNPTTTPPQGTVQGSHLSLPIKVSAWPRQLQPVVPLQIPQTAENAFRNPAQVRTDEHVPNVHNMLRVPFKLSDGSLLEDVRIAQAGDEECSDRDMPDLAPITDLERSTAALQKTMSQSTLGPQQTTHHKKPILKKQTSSASSRHQQDGRTAAPAGIFSLKL